jgi:hypothetical protein
MRAPLLCSESAYASSKPEWTADEMEAVNRATSMMHTCLGKINETALPSFRKCEV